METRKVFVSAGHSNVKGLDNGADGINGIKEGELTVELRRLVVDYLAQLGQSIMTDSDCLVTKDTVKLINNQLGMRDIAVDIHFNAFPSPSAKGTEVIVPFKSSEFERQMAKALVDNISACLGTKNRGVITEANSARGRLMFMTPNCENILVEVCFLTNSADVLMYLAKKDMVAQCIAKCIFDYMTK